MRVGLTSVLKTQAQFTSVRLNVYRGKNMIRSMATLVALTLPLAVVLPATANDLEVRQLLLIGACARCDLSNVDLSHAHLIGVDLRGANLQGTNLTHANLEGADLTGANLQSANLTGAFLTNAVLNYTQLEGANLSAATLHHTEVTGASFTNITLTGAQILDTPISIGSDE
jgi:uncharacterized protein YjbI with pentapeptide repeats